MARSANTMAQKNKPSMVTVWLFSATVSSLLLGCLWLFGVMHYYNNDDGVILRLFMGYRTSTLPTFHLYLNALLVYPLRWLGIAFPGVAWFSYLQLFFLWLACIISSKSILRCFVNAGHSTVIGGVASVGYLLVFAMMYCAVITYTVTAAMLAAAAVLQILSVDCERETDAQIIRGMLVSLVMVVLAYSLRQITALPTLLFCVCAILYQGIRHFGIGKVRLRTWRPLVVVILVFTVTLGTLAGLRELEINAKGMNDYLRWQRARIAVMDYPGVALPDALLTQIGWSQNELKMVEEWYFMDTDISAEAFETIAAYRDSHMINSIGAKLTSGLQVALSLFRQEPLAMRSVWLLLGVIGLSGIGLLLMRRDTRYRWLMLAATVLLSIALLLYLGMGGRMPLRAALMVILPTAALLFGLLADCMPPYRTLGKPGRLLVGVLACGLLGLTLWYAIPAAQSLAPQAANDTDESTFVDAFADLDEYALENPDLLFIYDATFTSDKRMFPDTSRGIPTNVMFWGGWGARSPEYVAQLAAFGIDVNDMDATVFLRDHVRLARGLIDPQPEMLMAYLRELTGSEIDYTFDGEWGGVHIYQMEAY